MNKDPQGFPVMFFGLCFGFTLSVSYFVQLILIPTVFPNWNLGYGLIFPDALAFHTVAEVKAIEINAEGWRAWEFSPSGHRPAGLISVLYVVFGATPYVILPLNAFIHSVSGYFFFKVTRLVVSRRMSFIGVIFFLANPMSLQWVAQIHRDGFFVLGILIALNVILEAYSHKTGSNLKFLTKLFFLSFTSVVLVWWSRPYFGWLLCILVTASIVVILLTNLMLRKTEPGRPSTESHIHNGLRGLGLIFVFVVSTVVVKGDLASAILQRAITSSSQEDVTITVNAPQVARKQSDSLVDSFLAELNSVRKGVRKTGGSSLIDISKEFESIGAVVTYAPRALQIALFAPFPNLWISDGSTEATTAARKLLGLVTCVSYVCLFGLFCWLVSLPRHQLGVPLGLLTFCISGSLIFTYAYPNVGTLLRLKYAFHYPLVSLGFAILLNHFSADRFIQSYGKE